jgi:hypothetical protein
VGDLRARLQANGASDLAIAWRVDHDPVRREFLRGAEAMRARILAGIRRWWGVEAKKAAGYRWPGHPHWLESAVAGIDAEQLLHPPDGPTDLGRLDAKSLGQPVDGGSPGAGGTVTQAPQRPLADP